jgi:hypothetical protein
MTEILNLFLSGSSVEGQSSANHFRRDNKLQDVDVTMEIIHLYADSQIVSVQNAPGFVRVKWSSKDETVSLPHDDEFVDGFKIKQNYVDRYKSMGQQDSVLSFNYNTKPDLASIEYSVRMNFENNPRLFYNAIKYAQTLEKNENKMKNYIELFEHEMKCGVDIFSNKFREFQLPMFSDKQYYQDTFTMLSPAFGFRMSNDYRTMLEAVLAFYFNYRDYFIEMTDILRELEDPSGIFSWIPEFDIVPSLKLDFWPDDMQWFLNRLERNRPNLFEKIYPLHMHIIPKWSGKTTEALKNFEFRYSFSLIEIKMAEERSLIEQILNRVARGIFYKYLHKSVMNSSLFNEKYLPSYFVKTTVLWMCETMDLDKIFTPTTTYDQQTEKKLADRLSKRWMTFARSNLKTRSCPHYFIKDLNILDGFSLEYLDKLFSILKNDVDLNDDQLFYAEQNFVGLKELTEEQITRWIAIEELYEQPDFVSDSMKLYNLLTNDPKFSIALTEDDDDEEHESYVVLQAILLLYNMAVFENSQMNNWQLWKKVFLTDVSEQSPVLYPDDKRTKRVPFFIALTMFSIMDVERIDKIVSNKEFSTLAQNAYSKLSPSFDNLLSMLAMRNLPFTMQQQIDQTHQRTVSQDPTNMVLQFLENYQREAPFFWNMLLYPDGAESNDKTTMTKEIQDETTPVMEDKPMVNRDEFDICIHQSIPLTPVLPKHTRKSTPLDINFYEKENYL